MKKAIVLMIMAIAIFFTGTSFAATSLNYNMDFYDGVMVITLVPSQQMMDGDGFLITTAHGLGYWLPAGENLKFESDTNHNLLIQEMYFVSERSMYVAKNYCNIHVNAWMDSPAVEIMDLVRFRGDSIFLDKPVIVSDENGLTVEKAEENASVQMLIERSGEEASLFFLLQLSVGWEDLQGHNSLTARSVVVDTINQRMIESEITGWYR